MRYRKLMTQQNKLFCPPNSSDQSGHCDPVSTSKPTNSKLFLLYFAPIVFQNFPENSLAHESNLQNLKYLIFALRSMYESVDEAKLCGYLLEVFCYNMSIRYPLKKFDSINFHLLRHLAWQCKLFGPLWTTSATMFESANNHLIKTLTGTVNTCSLIVKRYIRNRQFDSMEVKNDNLTGFLEALRGKSSGFKDDFSMKRNNVLSNFQKQFPEARLFCRHRGKFYLDSQLYTRSEANSFVSLSEENEIFCRPDFVVP